MPIVIVAYPLDILFSKFFAAQEGRSSTSGEFQIWNKIFSGDIDAQVLVYGSSRAGVNINNNIITQRKGVSTYNLGDFGNLFPIIYLRHLIYQRYNAKPEAIIFSLGLETFHQDDNLFFSQQLMPYMLWDATFKAQTERFRNFSEIDYDLPLKRYMGEAKFIYQVLRDQGDRFDTSLRGYRPIDRTWKPMVLDQKVFRVKLDSIAIGNFHTFLTAMKRSGVKVALVMTPYHSSGFKDISANQEVLKMYQDMAGEYNIPFLDYTSGDMVSDSSYFFDVSHLSIKGAEEVTSRIIDDLELADYWSADRKSLQNVE